MDNTKLLDKIRHEYFKPLHQCINAHAELAKSNVMHISSKVLRDIGKRIQELEQELMVFCDQTEKEEK